MPQMDGLTLVRELRDLPSYKHTPLLVLTTEATRTQDGRPRGRRDRLARQAVQSGEAARDRREGPEVS